MRPSGIWSFAWILWLGLVPACAPVATAPPPPALPPPVDTSYPGAKLVVGSSDLLGKVTITEPQFRKQGRLTEAVVTVGNVTGSTYVLEYLFEWEDEKGFTVDQVRVWQRFTLTPYQITKFTSTGPVPEATRITFTVRYPESKL